VYSGIRAQKRLFHSVIVGCSTCDFSFLNNPAKTPMDVEDWLEQVLLGFLRRTDYLTTASDVYMDMACPIYSVEFFQTSVAPLLILFLP
jgi:hypothetical protein